MVGYQRLKETEQVSSSGDASYLNSGVFGSKLGRDTEYPEV
jgi:hypothetical protein